MIVLQRFCPVWQKAINKGAKLSLFQIWAYAKSAFVMFLALKFRLDHIHVQNLNKHETHSLSKVLFQRGSTRTKKNDQDNYFVHEFISSVIILVILLRPLYSSLLWSMKMTEIMLLKLLNQFSKQTKITFLWIQSYPGIPGNAFSDHLDITEGRLLLPPRSIFPQKSQKLC